MKKIIFFSSNKNKINEIKKIFHKTGIEVLSLENFQKLIEPNEDGTTFCENAKIKSNFGYLNFNSACFADDSGICIDALDGEPGIRSKRFIEDMGGESRAFTYIIKEVIKNSNFAASFKTCIALTYKNNTILFEGVVKGKISQKPRGENGFGYDPIFIPEDHNKTFAEMSVEEKNLISHRYRASIKLKEYLLKLIV